MRQVEAKYTVFVPRGLHGFVVSEQACSVSRWRNWPLLRGGGGVIEMLEKSWPNVKVRHAHLNNKQ